ncbi:MAG: heat-inducible transcription repressor HrcA [Deltaproteobacteria bacterium]|nr:heat-inducible transcription repressor HrcA [Deltaproteobacteria bacterium]MBW2052182.1 heat-inducible transcription repressor HrcA [Deltaproteobacteria bacterium]MBW2141384.1 heat-inducible transcription repressor HrcA [Deltaproteobacteria bacterium]MBW2323535.1 heat-inducible transcription repressor HrcA [Deltaproteobacteria bacterium]
MGIVLNERSKKILHTVIQTYIRTAEPVGSRTVAKTDELDISPATIRNVMADLEEIGLLAQRHTSSGRVPTELGLRYYVDSILEINPISDREMKAIEQEFAFDGLNTEQFIKKASKTLSLVSHHIGLVLAPRFSYLELKQLEFIRLGRKLVLAILVSQSGVVQNRIIELDEDITQEELDRFNLYLNDILDGLTIGEIKDLILEEMKKEKVHFNEMFSRALKLSQKIFVQEAIEDDLYIVGQGRLLDYPEFSDVETMKIIFEAFEEKKLLIQLLDKAMSVSGVQIFIGSENELTEIGGWTIITSAYSRKSIPIGSLGILGPTRLNYSRIIPIVDYTAKLLTRTLESIN